MEGACPNLLTEACLYRYPDTGRDESPLDEHNHALAALRYLISRLDERRMARRKPSLPPAPGQQAVDAEAAKREEMRKEQERQRKHLWTNPDCWTTWRV